MLSLLLVSLFSIISVKFYIFFMKKHNYWKNKKVPFVKPTAVLGNFGEYIFLKKYIGHVAQDICRKYPDEPYVGAFYGSEPVLIVKDPELIKLVLTKDFYYFSNREISKYTHLELMTQNLFFTFGDRWKVTRQNLTPIFSSVKMRNMFHLIEKCCYVLEDLLDYETKLSNKVDVKNLSSRFTMDCIGACAFGVETKTMEKGSTYNPFLIFSRKVLNNSTTMAIKWITRAMWPAIFYGLGFKTFSTEGNTFYNNLLINVFRERQNKPSTRNDFLDSIISFKNSKYIIGDSITNAKAGERRKVELEVDDDFLLAQCLGFFTAGYETTSTTLANTLFELAKDTDAQRRVQKEIDDFLVRHDNVKYEVVKELTYTEACVDEVLRLYPVLAVITREVVEDYTFPTGLRLEKDMRVHIPIYHMHHNPEYFPEPKKFKPDRFLPQEKQNIRQYTYMPFGEGPRICIGIRFVKMQLLAGLLTIMKKFDVDLAEGMPRDLQFDPRGIVSHPIPRIRLKFTPRHSGTT